MDIENILEILKSGNTHLDLLVKTYFVDVSRLDRPVLGNYSFKDVEGDFMYSLREYSITHSEMIEPSKSPSLEELLKMNTIPENIYESFKKNVDDILKTYTDENYNIQKQNILHEQISKFIDGYPDEEIEKTKYRMFQALAIESGDNEKRNRYLDSILSAMKEAEVNQMQKGKYMVISSLLDTYNELEEFLEDFNFKEKKKYLQKEKRKNPDIAKKLLKKFVGEFLKDDEQDEKISVKYVMWFFFYLIYGKSKIDIFMIHSILGYKYDGAKKLYQKLFCKDHSTGRNNDFLHHIDILNPQYYNLEDKNPNIYDTVLYYL